MNYETFKTAKEILQQIADVERAEILLRPPKGEEKMMEVSYKNRSGALATLLRQDLGGCTNDGFTMIHERLLSRIVEFAYNQVVQEKKLLEQEFKDL